MFIELDIVEVVTFITLISSVGGLIWWIHELIMRFAKMEKDAAKREKDAQETLTALLACLDGLLKAGVDDDTTKIARDNLEKYIIHSR